jgi:hypothetical protein
MVKYIVVPFQKENYIRLIFFQFLNKIVYTLEVSI